MGKTAFLMGVIESFQETASRNHLRTVTRVVSFEFAADERLASQSGFLVGSPCGPSSGCAIWTAKP